MKKRLISLLTALLILAALPLTALAAVDIPVYNEFYENRPLNGDNYLGSTGGQVDTITVDDVNGGVITATDYDFFVIVDGVLYERAGVANYKDFGAASYIIIPPQPTDPDELAAWNELYSQVYVTYTRHVHLSYGWESSLTNHWCYCVLCGETYNMNWHWDYNKDDECDFCADPIHYYNITIKDMEGGSVTLNMDKARLNDEVQVTVTPDAGYELKEIRFYNLNQQHSQLVRWEDVPGKEYHFVVLPWDIEIEADFVKVG